MKRISRKQLIKDLKRADTVCFLGATFSYTVENLSDYFKQELHKHDTETLISKFGRKVTKANNYQIEFSTKNNGYSHYVFSGGTIVYKEDNIYYLVSHDNIVVYMLINKEEI